MPTISLNHVTKLYKGGGRHTAAVMNIDLEIEQGEFVFVVGSRGAGKSTLMDIMAGELVPDRGTVYLDETNITRLSRRRRRDLQAYLGRVAQDPALSRTDTVYENLTASRKLRSPGDLYVEEQLVRKALALVGMPGTEQHCPREFSFAQCRRLELAKAILHSPPILLLDGITDRLDDDTIWDIFLLLNEMNARGTTVVVTTNAKRFVSIMRRRVVTLSDGKLVGDVEKGRYGDIV